MKLYDLLWKKSKSKEEIDNFIREVFNNTQKSLQNFLAYYIFDKMRKKFVDLFSFHQAQFKLHSVGFNVETYTTSEMP